MQQQLSKRDLFFMSLFLFSILFGAGNLIFPPFFGHYAGENIWLTLVGFVLSDIGIFILSIIAIAKAGNVDTLLNRVHKKFSLIFLFIIYICIGPGLAVPRAGSLAFEMGLEQFLPETVRMSPLPLLFYTLVFFGIVYYFCMSPSKLINRFGKVLTPLLLLLIGTIFIRSFFVSLGTPGAAQGNYAAHPVIQGFLDGYLTMDGLAAFVYGSLIISTLYQKGITEEKSITKNMIQVGIGTGLLLGIVYSVLAYLGATTITLDNPQNGAQVLIYITEKLFGSYGNIILGIIFTVACFCVSVGLITSCGQFFEKYTPSISYKRWVLILCIASGFVANLGLTQIIAISGPILEAVFPVFITLMALGTIHPYIAKFSYVYPVTVLGISILSSIELVNQLLLEGALSDTLSHIPLHEKGIGFIIPAIIIAIISCFIEKLIVKEGKHEPA